MDHPEVPDKKKLVTRGFLERVLGHVGGDLGKAIQEKLDPLEARIKALEERPTVKHVGVWRDGEQYAEASMATHQGGLWIALRSTTQRPNASGDWQLIVKRGDAR